MSRKKTKLKKDFKAKLKDNYNKPSLHGSYEYIVGLKKIKIDTMYYLRKNDEEDLEAQVISLSDYLDEVPKEKIFDLSLVSDSVIKLKYLGIEGDFYKLATC